MTDKQQEELRILLERVDRCQTCLERWVDNPSLTMNAACLLMVKIIFSRIKNYSLDTEQKTLSILYNFLEKYIKDEFERNRKGVNK